MDITRCIFRLPFPVLPIHPSAVAFSTYFDNFSYSPYNLIWPLFSNRGIGPRHKTLCEETYVILNAQGLSAFCRLLFSLTFSIFAVKMHFSNDKIIFVTDKTKDTHTHTHNHSHKEGKRKWKTINHEKISSHDSEFEKKKSLFICELLVRFSKDFK